MQDIISNKLMDIEKENNVKIIYAIESGSRGWGFPSSDSDYDVRFIYTHEKDWYLNVFPQDDIIELPVDKVLDINGWDIKKVLQLLYKSNPSLLEWLSSPIIYRENSEFVNELKAVAAKCFISVHAIYHYNSLAKKSFMEFEDSENVKIKKLFYALRAVIACKWIEKYDAIPPMNLQEMLRNIEIDNNLVSLIEKLIVIKADCTEADTIKKPVELINFLDKNINYYSNFVKTIKYEKTGDTDSLNKLFRKTMEYYGEIK